MDENNHEDQDSSMKDKLKKICSQIKESWYRDCDRTEYMINLTNMLKEMLTHETLEEYFNNNEELLAYFFGDFLQEVINNILIQPKVYGDNGDKIAVDLLFHLTKLFLKFHKNNNYAPLFEKIRDLILYYR